jgi:hypothetical protein
MDQIIQSWMIIRLENNELKRKYKEVVVVYFKAVSRHLPGQTQENNDKLQSR